MLTGPVHDAGWNSFFPKLTYKAVFWGVARREKFSKRVDPRGTSERCPCGAPNTKRLSDREHVCLHCGLRTTRDHASAIEVFKARTEPSAANRGAVRLRLTEKPPASAGEHVTAALSLRPEGVP